LFEQKNLLDFLSRRIILIVLLCVFTLSGYGQSITVCSWNLKDFGRSKNNQEIEFIANTIKDFDVVAIQEVVAGYGGAQAVARLHDALNRKGTDWDYSISEPTSGSSYKTERYAYIWKTSKLKKIGDAWLERKFNLEIDREPFFIRFSVNEKAFTLVNFHAITKSKQPETEIKYFRFFPESYPEDNLIFLGDFNLPQSHTVFNPLRKMGFVPSLEGVKTSLKRKCVNSDCMASEFDNFFFNQSTIVMVGSGIIPFFKTFSDLSEARLISDHVPIYFEFTIR
jgi:deoxyribonuclease-1-like protein